jgi:tetratricopeptide (TPR) repeat protein
LLKGCRRLAIYGLGGCGKTALVLEAAYQTREQQPECAVFWVPAVSQESFEQAYRDIGLLLRIPGVADAKADVKQLVKARLSDEGFGQWLMIIDNADDVGVLFGIVGEGSSADRLIDYLPRSRKGSVIFTTRTAKAANDLAESNVIELGELGKEEAKEMLRTRLLLKHQHQVENKAIVDEFLGMLNFLALAIVQAVAFINQNDSKVSEYILLYRASEQEATKLLSGEFHDQGRYREVKNPVATTWYVSFEQIQEHDKLAVEHLSFMACTASNDIPESMLPTEGSQVAQTKAIGTLKAYAFITERETTEGEWQGLQEQEQAQRQAKAFDVHSLVHLAMRGWLKAHDQWLDWVGKTTSRLVEVIPSGDIRTRDVWTAYLPHAVHVAGLPELYETEERASLLHRVGECEKTLGQYGAAEWAYRQVLAREEKVLGNEHSDTLTTRNNLAMILDQQGKSAEAEQMHKEALVLWEKVAGKEHQCTLAGMSGIAAALNNQGKHAEAEQMFRETLALVEKVLGKEHPDTLISMNNLAHVLGRQGKNAEAEQMLRETLTLREKVSGKEDPGTLAIMHNLAQVLGRQGKDAEGTQIYQETLPLAEKVLGKEHPHMLLLMHNLGQVLGRQGRNAEAEQLHRKTLAIKEKVLGREDLGTLMSMDCLARELSDQGKHAEAEQIHRETLALREKVLGKEHPDTLTNLSKLVAVLDTLDKHEETVSTHEEIIVGGENCRDASIDRVLVQEPTSTHSEVTLRLSPTKPASKRQRLLRKLGWK